MNILTARQIKDLDQFTIENEPISSLELMERAAGTAFEAIYAKTENDRFAIFCGTGNNGGDGLVISRMMYDQSVDFRVFILGDPEKGSEDFRKNLYRLSELNVDINYLSEEDHMFTLYEGDIVIDAIFGSGISGEVTGWRAEVIDAINKYNNSVVSIDLPSGLLPDLLDYQTGMIIEADVTLSFHCPKRAFIFAENERYCGEIVVLDIGLMESLFPVQSNLEYLIPEAMSEIMKSTSRFSHKGNFGHALLFAGSYGKMGASVLSSRAALRSGLGLLTAQVPKYGYEIYQTSVPEAMCVVDPEEHYLNTVLDYPKIDAVGIGPGIGKLKNTGRMLSTLLDQTLVPIILDADALNLLAQEKEKLKQLPYECILTPHPKEFDRLFGDHSSSFDRLKTLQMKSIELNAIIILKGAFTRIAVPDGQIFINSTGNPGMATAGSGDVLTGIILSFLAQGYIPENAAKLGVYLHGLAGDIAMQKKGMRGMISSDIIDCIPDAINLLEKASLR